MRFTLASVLSLWIAGAGCMLGCESMAAMAAPSGNIESSHHQTKSNVLEATGDTCAASESNSSHDCCKKKARTHKAEAPAQANTPDASLPEFGGSNSGTMNSCPLAMSRAVAVGKSHDNHSSVSAIATRSVIPDFESRELTAPLSTPLRLPNRGHTYLHCCAFLI
ncbi:MAG TPA: hypothetical protein VJU86_20905 [Pyrinomonadaceae bacterium]|nr:hypothetical protein [Pyrinomonadaceae bacterium]